MDQQYDRSLAVAPSMKTENRKTIEAALARFVTILCDGAYDTEGEDAHLDVIALAYVMPESAKHDWGAWPNMIEEWRKDGRAPKFSIVRKFANDETWAADMVASAIADGLDDGLLVLWWGTDDVTDQEAIVSMMALNKLAIISPKHGDRLLDHVDAVLDKLDREDGTLECIAQDAARTMGLAWAA